MIEQKHYNAYSEDIDIYYSSIIFIQHPKGDL